MLARFTSFFHSFFFQGMGDTARTKSILDSLDKERPSTTTRSSSSSLDNIKIRGSVVVREFHPRSSFAIAEIAERQESYETDGILLWKHTMGLRIFFFDHILLATCTYKM